MIDIRNIKELIRISILLAISLIGGKLGIILFYVFSLLYVYKYRVEGATKFLMLLAYRSIVNDALFYPISSMQTVKWIMMFSVSTYIILGYKMNSHVESNKLAKLSIWIVLFSIYILIDSFIVSSLPFISIFKFFSYIYVFIATLKGIALTHYKVDWISWLEILIGSVVIISIPFYSFSIGWLGKLFKGFTNQPNMFGIILVLFISLVTVNVFLKKKGTCFRLGMIALSFLFIFLSGSRTAFISALMIIILGIFTSDIHRSQKLVIITFLISISFLIIQLNGGISEYLSEFIYKYDASNGGNLFYSRESQIKELVNNISLSPVLGNGFATPKLDFISYSLSYSFFLEPGNIILAILSYSGIIGTILFTILLLSIIRIGFSHKNIMIILPVSTLLVSMGEMVFFSSNSMAIWLYAFWAIYMFGRNDLNV